MAPRLTAIDLLNLWERGLTNSLINRMLDLLATNYPELTFEQWKAMPLGLRDLRLLEIREVLFGPRLTCLTTCSKCSENLELGFDVAQLYVIPSDAKLAGTYSISVDDCEVQFRLPNSSDLLQISSLPDITLARRSLFERCLLQATRAGNLVSANDISDEIMNATAARLAEIDQQADLQISLSCPACSHQWSTAFDIASFLWTEVNVWALRILDEVHRLASAYGWSEDDILALSPLRRQIYLEMIG